jgi:lipid-A-disaccharide synthase
MPTFALVAGELSGDQLGADLITRLKERFPAATFVGIGGAKMRAAGMESWWDSDELAVFGLFEVLRHVPRIWRIRRALIRRIRDCKPDVFIGIDAPDFNLGLEIRLKKAGIRTVHYVSPTIWAWRAWRARKIARAADLVLCLFPFEPEFYATHGVSAVFIGHPLADQIEIGEPEQPVSIAEPVIALLPGSRAGEVERMAPPMLEAAAELAGSTSGIKFVAAIANSRVRTIFEQAMAAHDFGDVTLVENDAQSVIAGSDVVMLASGTATLETMLINRPMVVAYRVSAPTAFLARTLKLVKIRYVALPNILADTSLVPELMQDAANGRNLAAGVMQWLTDTERRIALSTRFTDMHRQLRRNASVQASRHVAALLNEDDSPS